MRFVTVEDAARLEAAEADLVILAGGASEPFGSVADDGFLGGIVDDDMGRIGIQ